MRIPILRGRDIRRDDQMDSPRVVVVNQYTATKYWPHEDAVGKRIVLDDSTVATVIGVAKNTVRQEWSAPAEEEMFFPFFQSQSWMRGSGAARTMTLVARVACRSAGCDAAMLAAPLRNAVLRAQANVPISGVQTMRAVVDQATSDSHLYMALLEAFAASAILLAAVGVYGIMSYSVSVRRQELGIRIALGADSSAIMRLVVTRAMSLAGVGIAAGMLMSALAAPLLRGLLFGVSVEDPFGFVLSALILAVVALAASIVPALIAARIDPLRAMRTAA